MNNLSFTDLSSIHANSEYIIENEDISNIKNILKDFEKDIILCKECDSHILIQFIDFDKFISKCNCEGEEKTYSIEKDYNQFYLTNDINDINNISLESNSIQEDNISDKFSCKKHGNKLFKFYCMLCQNNLCDVCKISHTNNCKITI